MILGLKCSSHENISALKLPKVIVSYGDDTGSHITKTPNRKNLGVSNRI